MQFTFESWFRVISGVLKVANLIDCFCPYLSVSVLDCVPLLHLNGVQLPLITILFISSGTYIYIATAYAKTH